MAASAIAAFRWFTTGWMVRRSLKALHPRRCRVLSARSVITKLIDISGLLSPRRTSRLRLSRCGRSGKHHFGIRLSLIIVDSKLRICFVATRT
jgi:hypothetical protein